MRSVQLCLSKTEEDAKVTASAEPLSFSPEAGLKLDGGFVGM